MVSRCKGFVLAAISRLVVEMMLKDGVSPGLAKPSKAVQSFEQDIARADKQLSKSHKFNIDTGELDNFSQHIGLLGAAVTAIGAVGVTAFASFDGAIASVGAVSGATADELDQLRSLALQIGQDTAFSATEAAGAMEELLKAGVSVTDVLNGAADAAVALAAATGTSVPQAASIMASTMAVFNIAGTQAMEVADRFAAVANATRADVDQLAQGMAQAGNVANQFGLSFEDTIGVLGLFSQYGLDASDAGTSLKTMLLSLLAPTTQQADLMKALNLSFFDAQGNFIGVAKMADLLQNKLSGLSQEQRNTALAILFGSDAVRAANILYTVGADGVNKYTTNLNASGVAAQQAAARQDSLQGAIERMRGSVETAAIVWGGALAPAIEAGAKVVEQAANAFASLPGPIQSVIAASTGAVGGFSLLAAGMAKGISLAAETASSFGKMVSVIKGSAAAMSALSFATSPVGIGLMAVGLALAYVYREHMRAAQAAREQAAAARELSAAFSTLAKTIADLKIQGLTEAADAMQLLLTSMQNGAAILNGAIGAVNNGELGKFGDTISKFGGDAGKMQAAVDAISASQDDMQTAMQQSGIDTVALARDFELLVNQLLNNKITAEEYTTKVADITTHLDRYAVKTGEAADATGSLTDAQLLAAQASDEVAKAQERFNQQLDQTIQSSLLAISGLEDIAPQLDGLQTGFTKAGASASDIVKVLDKVGLANLSPANKQALQLARQLDRVNAAIARTQSAIDQNSGDMQMWAGRIQLVDDTLGTAEDGYAALNKMVADGRLTQAEANKILADANWLRERSVGGLEDERAEQAKQISVLADYVRQHDAANGAVQRLTESQKGFLAAMESSQGQTALQTVQLLAYLSTLGLIPPEKVTDYIVDAAAADPVLAALFEDLGLLPDKKKTAIIIDVPEGPLRDVTKTIGDIPNEKNVKVQLDFAQTGDGTEFIGAKEFDLPVKTTLEVPDTSAVDNFTPDTVNIPTTLDAPMDDLVTGYKPATIHVPTILNAPMDDLVAGYKPAAINVDVLMNTPTWPEGMTWSGLDPINVAVVADMSEASGVTDTLTALNDIDGKSVSATFSSFARGEAGAALTKTVDDLTWIDGRTVTATLAATDNASGTIQGVIDLINEMPNSKTISINTVNTTTTAARAGGGMVREAMTLVGESGPELVSLPYGSFVHTATQSNAMMKPQSPLGATSAYSGGRNGGPTTIIEEHYHFEGTLISEDTFLQSITKKQVDARVEAKRMHRQGQGGS